MVRYAAASSLSRARVRWRDDDRSSPTGNGAAHTSVAPASNSAWICAATAASSPTIAASAGPGRAADVEDPAVVRQHAVVGEHRRPRSRAPRSTSSCTATGSPATIRGAGRPAAVAAALHPRCDVRLDRAGVRHPQDRAVGELAGNPQQPGSRARRSSRLTGWGNVLATRDVHAEVRCRRSRRPRRAAARRGSVTYSSVCAADVVVRQAVRVLDHGLGATDRCPG